MLDRIEHKGVLIHDCSLPGETRADGVTPARPNGVQLSENRFLLLNATLGYRGVDDSLSTTWQLRGDGYDGALIKEGFFARTCNDWNPLSLGETWKKETGAIKWWSDDREEIWRSHLVGWTQFRLSDDANDIEILQPERMLRQEGFGEGEHPASRRRLAGRRSTARARNGRAPAGRRLGAAVRPVRRAGQVDGSAGRQDVQHPDHGICLSRRGAAGMSG